MMMINKRNRVVILSVFALCLMFLFCGCGATDGLGETATSGNISTDGSTSMEKTIGSLGEAYMMEFADVNFTFNPTGSGSGIVAVADGRCDIGLSSRALKDEEKARGLTETVLAYDGIAVVVNPENTVTDLTLEEIAAIYTGKITNWSELGGMDGEIVLVGREAASGTRSGFEEVVDVEGKCKYRQELTSSGDVMTSVAQNPNAIGYTSFASINSDIKVIAVDGIAPSEDTIKNGSYVVQRPFVLVTRTDVPLSPTAQAFFDYITSAEAASIISGAGVVVASSEE